MVHVWNTHNLKKVNVFQQTLAEPQMGTCHYKQQRKVPETLSAISEFYFHEDVLWCVPSEDDKIKKERQTARRLQQ